MFYYISTNSWNLLESFVSESISPFSFYQVRGYGNNLSRYLDGTNERANYLILSAKEINGDYVLRVNDEILAQVRKSVDSPPGMLTKRSSSHGTCFPIKSSTFASWQRRLPNLTTRYSYATCFQKGCLTPLKLPMSMKSALVYTMRRIRKSAFFISILTNVTCAMMCGMI